MPCTARVQNPDRPELTMPASIIPTMAMPIDRPGRSGRRPGIPRISPDAWPPRAAVRRARPSSSHEYESRTWCSFSLKCYPRNSPIKECFFAVTIVTGTMRPGLPTPAGKETLTASPHGSRPCQLSVAASSPSCLRLAPSSRISVLQPTRALSQSEERSILIAEGHDFAFGTVRRDREFGVRLVHVGTDDQRMVAPHAHGVRDA